MDPATLGASTLVFGFLFLYFLPTLIACLRWHNIVGVFLINLLLGWSVVGWIIALVMACTSAQRTVINNIYQGAPRREPSL